MRPAIWLIAAAMNILAVGYLSNAVGKIIEPNSRSPERQVLMQFSSGLDSYGIDTALCCSTNYPLSPSEVRLAPLADFKPHSKDWGKFEPGAWTYAFSKGAIGIVAAVPASKTAFDKTREKCETAATKLPIEACEFIRYWLSADKDKRIFIAFTRQDFESAQKIKLVLEGSGYKAFLFLKDKDDTPWADASMVGEIFVQAAHRLVVDTANSRSSAGVSYEQYCCEWLLSGSITNSDLANILKRGQ